MATTFDEARDAYLDNADYAEAGSVSKARAFVTACRRLKVLLPRVSAENGSRAEFDPQQLQKELEAAQGYVDSNPEDGDSTGSVALADLRSFRT